MKNVYTIVCLAACLLLSPTMHSTSAAATTPEVKPLKIVVGAIRYGRHKLALKFFAGEAQGKMLLEKNWAKGTPKQRAEFVKLFHVLFAKLALRKVESRFKYLKTIVYGKPVVKGDTAKVSSTIVILHALKKQELQVKYDLIKIKKKWKLVDVTTVGDSMLTSIRDKQVRKIMKKGGWKRLLLLMRKRADQLKNVKIK